MSQVVDGTELIVLGTEMKMTESDKLGCLSQSLGLFPLGGSDGI